MKRRNFIAALLALPLSGKLLEGAPSAGHPVPRATRDDLQRALDRAYRRMEENTKATRALTRALLENAPTGYRA